MKLRKWLGLLLSLMMVAAVAVGITACGKAKVEYVTLTWYDSDNILGQNDKHTKGTVIADSERPTVTEREGFTYDWYTSADGNDLFDFSQKIEKDTNIYLHWKQNELPHAHQYGAWSVTKQPTADATGTAERTCTAEDCNKDSKAEQIKVLPKLSEDAYTIEETKAPTCMAEGVKKYTYKFDDNTSVSFDVTVGKTAHVYEPVPKVDATCTADGTLAHFHCDECNQDFLEENGDPVTADQLKIDKLGHEMTEHPADPATCERQGTLRYFTCAHEDDNIYYADEDGTETLESIVDPQKGHTYGGDWHYDEDNGSAGHWQYCTQCHTAKSKYSDHDTEGEDGACSKCGYKETDTPVEHTHQYGPWKVTQQPTAQDKGSAERECTAEDCDNSPNRTETKELPVLSDENYNNTDHKAPSCTEKGHDTYQLKEDTSITFTVDVDMVAHSYGDPQWTWQGDAETGYTGATVKFTCDVCSDEQTPQVEFTQETVQNQCTSTTVYTATVHFNDKEYTEKKSVDTDKNAHNGGKGYGQLIEQKDPTCTAPGTKAHYHCDVCNKDFDEQHNDITGNLEIPATGHNYKDTNWDWKESGDTFTVQVTLTCQNDDHYTETVEANAKDIVLTASTDPTCTANGSKTYTATVVFEGKTYTNNHTVEIEKTGHSYTKDPTWKWEKSADGYTVTATFKCDKCDEGDVTETAKVTSERKEPTCVDNGTITYTATVTFQEKPYTATHEDTISATGNHTLGEWQKNDTNHWKECSVCKQHFEEDAHDESGDDGACSKCGYKKTDTPVEHTHSYGAWTVKDYPTTERAGSAERTCSADGCDQPTQTETLPALNDPIYEGKVQHTPATCEDDGKDTYTYDFGEGKGSITFDITIEKLGHDYENGTWKVTEQPEIGKPGKAERECAREECHEKYTVTLPALDSEDAGYTKGPDSATCTQPGEQQYSYTDPAHPDYGAITFTVNTSPKPHQYTWKYTLEMHWQDCEVCHNTTEQKGHDWDENGHCSTCDAQKYTATFLQGTEFKGDWNVGSKTALKGAQIELPSPTDNPGYTFEGWTLSGNAQKHNANDSYILNSDVEFTATWKAIESKDKNSYFIIGQGKGILKGSNWTDYNYTVRQIPRASVGDDVDRFELKKVLLYVGDVFKFRSINATGSNGSDPTYDWLGFNSFRLGGDGDDGVNYGNKYVKEAATDQNFEVIVSGYYTITFYTGNSEHHIDIVKTDNAPELTMQGMYLIGSISPAGPETWMGEAMEQFAMKQSGTTWSITVTLTEQNVPKGWADKQEGKVALKVLDNVYGKDYGVSTGNGTAGGNNLWLDPGTYTITFDTADGKNTITATRYYVVTFESGMDGVDAPEKAQQTLNSNITLQDLSNKAPTGYEFKGWREKDTQDQPKTGTYKVTKDVTLVGVWEKISYTVEYNAGDAREMTYTPGTQTVQIGGTITLKDDATAAGYTFAKWTVGGEEVQGLSVSVTEEFLKKAGVVVGTTITFTATWTPVNYKATYEDGVEGEEIEVPESTNNHHIGDKITLETMDKNIRTGYTFVGWVVEGTENVITEYTMEAKDVTFVATWKAKVYNVKFASTVAAATLPTAPETTSLEANTSFDLDPLTLAGYTFNGWSVNGNDLTKSDGGKYHFELTQDKIVTYVGADNTITITAKWSANTYTVVFAHTPDLDSGTKEQATNMPTVADGYLTVETGKNTFELTTPEREGYTFVKWTRLDGTTVEIGTFTLTADNLPAGDALTITFTANWKANDYHVTYDLKGGTVTSGTIEDTKVYHVRDEVKISDTEPTRTGYTFTGWTVKDGDGTVYKKDTAHTTYTMKAENVTFEAQWSANKYTIKFELNLPAEHEGTVDPASVDNQKDVTLEAEHSTINLPTLSGLTSHTFQGWTLNKDAGAPMKDSTNLTAEMIAQEQGGVITLYASWKGLGKVTAHFQYNVDGVVDPENQEVYPDTNITFPKKVDRTGYTFDGWRKMNDPQGTLYQPDATLQISEDITFEAVWTAITYTVKLSDRETNKEIEVTLDNATAEGKTFADPEARKGYRFNGWKLNGVKYEKLTAELIEAADPKDDAHTITLTADWSAIEYTFKLTVTAPKDGVEVDKSVESTVLTASLAGDHTSFTLPAPTAPTGYKFDGWQLSEGKVYQAGENTFDDTMIPASGETTITLTTKWSPIEYTVTLENGGHGGALSKESETMTVAENNSITLVSLTETGYDHTGWKIKGYKDSDNYKGSFALTAGLIEALTAANLLSEGAEFTLVAQWTAKTYKVVYDANAGGEEGIVVPQDEKSYSLVEGNNIITVKEMEGKREGYTFNGWKLGDEATLYNATNQITLDVDLIKKLNGDTITFKADWTINKYTVTFQSEHGEPQPEQVQVEYQGTLDLTQYTIKDTEDQHFLGWAYEESATDVIEGSITVTNNITLVAVWQPKLLVTFDVDGDTSEHVYVVKGEKIPDDAYPQNPTKEGDYRFDNWYKTGEEKAYVKDTPVTAPFTLEAKFIKQIHITYFDEFNDALSDKNETIDENTAATKATVENKGYKISTGSTINIWHSEWYLDEARTQKYNNDALETDTKLYRKWVETKGTTKVTVPSGRPTWIAVGDSYNGSPLEWSYAEYTAGKLKLDSSLEYHEVYTITLALFKYSNSDNKSGKFRFKQATTTDNWSNCKGYSDLYSSLATENFSLADDNNMKVKNSGIYKFVIIYQGNTAYLSYEKICSLSSSNDLKTGYYLVGSMTNWADQYSNPIYLGDTGKTGPFTQDIEITANDYGYKKDGINRYDHATAKVVVATTYSNKYIYVTKWDVVAGNDPSDTDGNYHFPEGTGTFRVTFTVTSTSSHTGTLSVLKDEQYTYEYNLGACDGIDYAGTSSKPQGGSVNSLGSDSDRTITLPETDPVWEGHKFLGWKVDGVEALKKANETVVLTKSVTITAQWIEQFEVTFSADPHDGGTVPEGGTFDKGTYTIPEGEPTRVGYTFLGWYVGETYQEDTTTLYKHGDATHGSFELTEATTFKAAWKTIDYTVVFDNNGHGTKPANATVTLDNPEIKLGEGVYLLSQKGYTFNGWEGQGVEENMFTLTKGIIVELGPEGSITLTAKWEAKTYTVKFEHDGLNGEEPTGMPTIGELDLDGNTTIDLTSVPTVDGYKFVNWKIQNIETPYTNQVVTFTEAMISDNNEIIVITAKWSPVGNYNVTYTSDSEKTVTSPTGFPETSSVTEGKVIDIPADEPTCKGYTFEGWYIGEDEETLYKYGKQGYSTYTVNEDVTFYAKWTAKEYDVTFESEHAKPTELSGKVSLDTPLTLENLSEEGWEFGGWTYNDQTYSDTFTLTGDMIPDDDATFTLTFTAKWTRKITVQWHVLGEEDVYTETHYSGAAIAETNESPYKPTKTDYVLDGWYKDVNYTDKYDFKTVLDDSSDTLDLYARFYKEKVTVNFYAKDKTTLLETKKVSGLSTVTASTKHSTVRFATFSKWFDKSTSAAFNFGSVLLDDVNLYETWTENAATKTYYKDTNVYKAVGGRYSTSKPSTFNSTTLGDPMKSTLTLTRDTFYQHHNVFTIELDLYVGDWFQITHGNSWTNQFGYGFLNCEDGTFLSYDPTAGEGNIVVTAGHAGRYRITLITVPTKASQTSFGFDGAVIVYEKLSTYADSATLGAASTEKIRATGSNIDGFANNSNTYVFTKLGVVQKDSKSYTVYYLNKSLSGTFKFTNGGWSNAYECDYWKWYNNNSKGGATGLSADGSANFSAASAKVYRVFYFVADNGCEHVEIMNAPTRPATT